MKLSLMKTGRLLGITTACLLAMHLPAVAQGPMDTLKKRITTEETLKLPTPEKPDAVRARIDQWYQEARDTLAKLDAPAAASALPEGITATELDDRRRGLEGVILISAQWLKNMDSAEGFRKASEASKTEANSWSGFKESPPYSILMIDELLNERDTIQARIASCDASLANYERLQITVIGETKAAEDTVRAQITEVQKADDSKIGAAKWRLEAAREKSRQLAARSGLFKSNGDRLRERISSAKADLLLVERKVKIATANFHFSDEDFSKLEKIAEERIRVIQKEADGVAKRFKAAKIPRDQAQAALDAATHSSQEGKTPADLDLAKFRLEVTQGRLDALQSISEWLEGLPQLEKITLDAYQNRRAFLNASRPQEGKEALEALSKLLDRIQAWENVLDTEISISESDLGRLESRAAAITMEDPRFGLFSEQRATKSEKLTMIQRASDAVSAQRKLIKRWIEEYSPKTDQLSFLEQVSSATKKAGELLKKIWAFEVMSFDDSIIVDGETIPGKIPITLGMLLRALLFFAISYWICSRIILRIHRSLVAHGHLAEAQAKTLGNWVMIVIGVFLAIGTLSFLKIPLTVFAFFGGALAIGLGFGTQTLIKNFISGIIVLAERKVRVGDILDVDGIVGTVVEINTRSSVIRSADEVETMIPNSLFLENRVTNWTLSSSRMRRSLRVGVRYGTSPQEVIDLLTESASRHDLILKDPQPFAVFEDFGENALMFSLYFWLELKASTNAMIVTSDLRLMIDKRFSEMNIGFPFPQRDMHLLTDKPLKIEWTEQATDAANSGDR